MNKIELRAAADRLMYENNHNTADYNMLIDYIDHSEIVKPDRVEDSRSTELPKNVIQCPSCKTMFILHGDEAYIKKKAAGLCNACGARMDGDSE